MVEYKARTKQGRKTLSMETSGEGELDMELKPGVEDWQVEMLAEQLAEIAAKPFEICVMTETDIEVSKKRKRPKAKAPKK